MRPLSTLREVEPDLVSGITDIDLPSGVLSLACCLARYDVYQLQGRLSRTLVWRSVTLIQLW